MRWFILCSSPERGAELADSAGIGVENAVLVTSLESCAGLSMDHGDMILIDNALDYHSSFWSVEKWPYIMQAMRTLNWLANNPWIPRFT